MRYAGFSGSFRYVRTCNPKKMVKKKLKNFVGGGIFIIFAAQN